jgi:4-amino-4-deoxy-L-arabinose transferase-like glycosyltransferase
MGLSALTLGVGLGGSGRLTYHEAFVAQAAREMVARGDALVPTIGGRPWLEKPPLAVWLAALAGRAAGDVSEAAARVPSAAAALLTALGVAAFAARRFGPSVGLLAGLVQATTAWTVMRGRLAEVDILLAALVTWAVVAFDRLRGESAGASLLWRWLFFAALGLTGLAKGVGFGAVLVGAVVVLTVAWDRDRPALRALRPGAAWALAGLLGLTWPVLVAFRHPSAVGLWALHVTDRLAEKPEHFIGTPWGPFLFGLLGQTLPWTPLALAGAWRSLGRACARRGGGDRLLWTWSVAPLLLLALATVRSPHYAIHALPPWSVWAALGVARLGARLQGRGWSPGRVRRWAWAGFAGLGLAYALGYAALGPRLDRRGVEWAFYQSAARLLRPGEPLALLYNVPDWDRKPYPSPFGPVPHDLAVRLYYLDRPACWRFGAGELAAQPPAPGARDFAVIGRDADLPALRQLGRVETLARGPHVRRDRTYLLLRVTPGEGQDSATDEHRLTQIGGRWGVRHMK